MKFTPNIFEKRSDDDADRSRPRHMFGGRVRISTLVLIVAFVAVWWTYDTYKPQPSAPEGPPATQVVPPGFVPDPNYTWVPRSRVRQPPADTYTPTPTTTAPSTTVPPSSPPGPPPPFQLPCIPPLCTPTPSPDTSPPQLPQPGPGPVPTSAPPAS